MPFRFLEQEQQFARYQWIDVDVRRARNDPRPESNNLNGATLKISQSLPPVKGWGAREQILAKLRRPSLCQIQDEHRQYGHPTLGLFRPTKIKRLRITAAENQTWTAGELAILNQERLDLGGHEPRGQLEKIPFEFRYEFECAGPSCKGHALTCTDWEMLQAYRSWRRTYGEKWETKFREQFERNMIERNDTSFFVGTLHQHPNSWIIVGLFYPPKPTPGGLFDV